MDDLISRKDLLEAYDKAHQGPPGGARKLIEEAPRVFSIKFSEKEFEKILQYQKDVLTDTAQEAIMDAISVRTFDDVLRLVCRIEDRKKKGAIR